MRILDQQDPTAGNTLPVPTACLANHLRDSVAPSHLNSLFSAQSGGMPPSLLKSSVLHAAQHSAKLRDGGAASDLKYLSETRAASK